MAAGFEALIANLDEIRAQWVQARERGLYRLCEFAESVALEEAAKVIILFDFVQMPWNGTQDKQVNHLRRFESHFAKALCARAHEYRPSTFDELRRLIDGLREEWYLDGDFGFEHIYPNQLLVERDERFYVSCIDAGEGLTWASPVQRAQLYRSESSPPDSRLHRVFRTVDLLAKGKLLAAERLPRIHELWSGLVPEPATSCFVVADRWNETLQKLGAGGLSPEETRELIAESRFPMWGVDLAERPTGPSLADVKAWRAEARRDWEP